MSKTEKNRAWVGLIVLITVLFFIGWMIYDVRFKHDLDMARKNSAQELELVSSLIQENLQKRNYQLAKSFISTWGDKSVDVVEITLVAENGFELGHYQRAKPANHVIAEQSTIEYSYNSRALISIRRSIDDVHAGKKLFLFQLLAGFFFISFALFYLTFSLVRAQRQKELISYENVRRKRAEKSLKESITELLDTQRDLKEKEENLNITLNSIGDAVIATDASGHVARMNPVAEKLCGWLLHEAKGMPLEAIFSIIDATTHKPIPNPVEKVFETGETVFLANHTILIAKDGTEHHIADSAAPIRNGDNNILGIVLVFNDVTEQKRQEEQLRQSQKMDALGMLTGGIAHDYNNMIGIVLGFADLMRDELKDQPILLEYANEIYTAGERGARLTNKLLDFTRDKPSAAQILNVNSTLLGERNMLEKTLMSSITLAYELEDDLWLSWLDSSDLENAIINLCINAKHSMDSVGTLTIRTTNVYLNTIDARILRLNEGEFIRVSVADTGCGMDQATKDRIFDPFFSTKGEAGTGLGLAQIYGFVSRSKGVIKVYSEVDHGSQFSLYFPRYIGEDIKEQKVSDEKIMDTTGSETILIVDDEVALLNITTEIFSKQGYRVLVADHAKKALEVLESESIDLILSDVIMPEMDGYQLAAIVREKYPSIKIQLASGFADDRQNEMTDQDLCQEMIHKPYNSKILLQKVRSLLNR